MFKIAIFVSGRGSNLKAVIDSSQLKNLIEICAVLSDKTDCPALSIAQENSIKTYTVGESNKDLRNEELPGHLSKLDVNFLVLAGYLKLIPVELIKQYKNKIINIHPALLPSFGGKGMYGMNVHRAVFNSSAQISGATIHFVDETYDTGKIIAQRCVDISKVKSPEEIASTVLRVEHKLLPFVIEKFALDKVKVENERVYILS